MDWFVNNVCCNTQKNLTQHSELLESLIKGDRISKRIKWQENGCNILDSITAVNDKENDANELMANYDSSEQQDLLTNKYKKKYLSQWQGKVSQTMFGKFALLIYSLKKQKKEWFEIIMYDLIFRPITSSVDERTMLNGNNGMCDIVWNILINVCKCDSQLLVLKTNYEVWKTMKKDKLKYKIFCYSCSTFFQECEYYGNIKQRLLSSNRDDYDILDHVL